MKFLKNRKFAAAALCALLLAAGGQTYAAGTPRTWTADRLTTRVPVLSTLEGTIQDFAVDDEGNTVWQVLRTGDAQDAPLVGVTVTKDTKLDFEGNAANGDIISVSYVPESAAGAAGGNRVAAARVSKRTPLPQVDVSGEVVALSGEDGFRLRQFGQGEGADIIFHYGPDTKLPAGKGGFQTGDRVTVTYNGILARSLPPQGYAQIISMFDAPASAR